MTDFDQHFFKETFVIRSRIVFILRKTRSTMRHLHVRSSLILLQNHISLGVLLPQGHLCLPPLRINRVGEMHVLKEWVGRWRTFFGVLHQIVPLLSRLMRRCH